jgi:hypothetical protein
MTRSKCRREPLITRKTPTHRLLNMSAVQRVDPFGLLLGGGPLQLDFRVALDQRTLQEELHVFAGGVLGGVHRHARAQRAHLEAVAHLAVGPLVQHVRRVAFEFARLGRGRGGLGAAPHRRLGQQPRHRLEDGALGMVGGGDWRVRGGLRHHHLADVVHGDLLVHGLVRLHVLQVAGGAQLAHVGLRPRVHVPLVGPGGVAPNGVRRGPVRDPHRAVIDDLLADVDLLLRPGAPQHRAPRYSEVSVWSFVTTEYLRVCPVCFLLVWAMAYTTAARVL